MSSLLVNIAYYMNSQKRVDNKNGIDKSSKAFTDETLHGIRKYLEEINLYPEFTKIDVILDVNQENTDVYKIDFSVYQNINNIQIISHSFTPHKDEHPFRLTTKHRFNVLKNINSYDWFMYAEDDTIISKESISFLIENSNTFFQKTGLLYTIPRLVYDYQNNYFFSDIIKPSSIQKTNKNYKIPTNRFGACWFYSQKIVKEWINHKSFLNFNFPNVNGGIRVKMGLGFLEKQAVIPINNKTNIPEIQCVHLGYSGKNYFKHPSGFHTLPIHCL